MCYRRFSGDFGLQVDIPIKIFVNVNSLHPHFGVKGRVSACFKLLLGKSVALAGFGPDLWKIG